MISLPQFLLYVYIFISLSAIVVLVYQNECLKGELRRRDEVIVEKEVIIEEEEEAWV